MKILHLCLSCFYIDNYSYQENLLPKYHVLQGHEVQVLASLVSFDEKGNPCLLKEENEYSSKDNYKVIRTNYKRPFYFFNKIFRRYNKVFQHINNFHPDIIFIHDCQFWDIFEVIKYLKRHPEVKVFVDGHTDLMNSARNWLSREILHKIVWRHCAQAINPFTEKFYGVLPIRCDFFNKMYGIPPEKIELLVMGVDDIGIPFNKRDEIRISTRKELGISAQDFVIVTGGKIDKKKNIDLLIQAVQKIKNPSVKLIIFGNIHPEMESIILPLIQDDSVFYVGWINSELAYKYFFVADLAVFPGTHSVLWEYAVGCGIPAIFKRWDGMGHVDVGGNALFIDEVSVDELTKIISQVISNSSLYNQMDNVAKIKAVNSFKYSTISEKAIRIGNYN
jgi:1,2-diacylglycerol 3-alpha-glucosyltransferase